MSGLFGACLFMYGMPIRRKGLYGFVIFLIVCMAGVFWLTDGKLEAVEQARKAEADGADYLGVGAMFVTGTKQDAKVTSKEELKRIRAAVAIPIVAIGGIKADNVEELKGTGIDGVAVVSAVIAAENIASAAEELAGRVKELKEA